MSDQVMITLIQTVGPILTAVVGLLTLWLTVWNTKKIDANTQITQASAKVAEETKQTVIAVEKSSNNMKDELIAVKSIVERAKGFKEGFEANAATEPGTTNEGLAKLVQTAQVEAAHADGVHEGKTKERERAAAEDAIKDSKIPL